MGMYMGGTRRGRVECSRVQVTTLVELWRVHNGVEGKP